ncbi:ferritin-like domain-containing protein [Nocardioides sp. JQ2195]|uniref:ferritin-like domain-containing protein n=1 Tax=Nocardioides sp. JQ2195 TaxID=2592334 RepID=UPI00143E7C22|nr:ferritin-like domain-containing protein [Nocardioides sp. JQ2195]QIX26257.1 ferritin-like domain-containing protein [Nocardioides sp. JQ2195]
MSDTSPLQTTLAAEHAAVWLYTTLGGQTSESAQPKLFDTVSSGYTRHRTRRDQLVRWIRDAGEQPVAAEVAYELPNQLRTPDEVEAAGLQIEQRCTVTYADMVGRTVAAEREWAIKALLDASLRELDLGGAPQDLPGIDT